MFLAKDKQLLVSVMSVADELAGEDRRCSALGATTIGDCSSNVNSLSYEGGNP